MVPATGIDGLISLMEELDPAREKEARLSNLVRGPLSDSVKALERRNAELPTGQDFHFYNNFQEFKRPVANIQSRVVTLLSQLGSLKDVIPHPAAFPADVEEGYDWLVGMQDAVLERVDASLDTFYLERKAEFKQRPGVSSKQNLPVKAPHAVAGEGTKSGDFKVARSKDKSSMRSPIPFHIPTIPRPQDKFDDAVDNSNIPFRHKVLRGRIQMESAATTSQEIRPGSGESSVISTLSVIEEHARRLGHKDSADNIHPWEEELTEMAYVEGLLDTLDVRKYESLDDTPFTLVTTPKALKEMAVKLREAGEIAIDLENHHYRSYQGFVCLMQVSTRDEDFIVDTLDLRSQVGPCLGDIFADPTIRKVMHGADRDIVWLQRDFGIYVCNLFDTGQAARSLQLQGFGLAFLLEHFCGVHADKRYQLADWRIRPLPSEMIKYAREDTHYLLYVHDKLKQLLLDARANRRADEDDPLLQVYKRSRDLCLQLYAKEFFTETSYQHLYGLQEKKFRPEQLAVLAALYSWRDSIARKEDESTGFVLPNHLLLQLASEMPDDVRQLQNFLKGSHSFVSRKASAVIEIIRQSKDKAMRELQEFHPELEEGELKGESPWEKPVSDEISSEVCKTGNSLQRKETVLEVASKSEDQEGKMETSFSLKRLHTDNLVTPLKASTSDIMTWSDILASETTGSDKAGDSLTDIRSREGQLQLKSDVLTGPVLVSRRTSSSLFGRKPQKTPSVPFPPSNVPVPKELGGISEAQDSPATLCRGPNLPTGSSVHGVDEVMSDAFTIEDGNSNSLDKGQGSGQTQEIAVPERTFTAGTAVTSMEIQIAGAISSATVEGIDRARDMPSMGPETSAPQVILREGKTIEIEVNATSGGNDIIPASVVIEKVSENAPIIQAKKKPSKLGSLLGGRKRVQQIVPSESAKDVEQAKIKTQDIESSMVLPFGPPVMALPDISVTNLQQPALGEAEAFNVPEERLDDHNEYLQEETAGLFDEETLGRPARSTAPQLPEVIMLETEADEVSRRIGSNCTKSAVGGEKSPKHRTWWPPVEDNSGLVLHRRTDSPRPGSLDSARDPPLDKPDVDGNPEVPRSLSEMHRSSKRGKKSRRHCEVSFDQMNSEVPGRDFGSIGSSSRNKKRRNEQSAVTEIGAQVKRVASTEKKVDITSFNYREARDVLGLENLYTEKTEDTQGTGSKGRGRESNKRRGRPGIPLSKTAFDPLRRLRVDPRPEGIQPGQRRQVFPQSGNRTSVFKK